MNKKYQKRRSEAVKPRSTVRLCRKRVCAKQPKQYLAVGASGVCGRVVPVGRAGRLFVAKHVGVLGRVNVLHMAGREKTGRGEVMGVMWHGAIEVQRAEAS